MRIFMTGATGFVGSHLVPRLIEAGHRVVGLTRSAAGGDALARMGAEALRGDVTDLDGLRRAAADADAVVHAAFQHDFANLAEHSANDRRAIEALGDTLSGSDRPLVVASGTGLVDRARCGELARETDEPFASAHFPRAATEEAAGALVARGVRAILVRLPQVHDTRHFGRITQHVELARKHGRVAYVGDGSNRLPAAHVSDAVRVFELALARGRAGARYHAVAEEGVTMRAIAETLGATMKLPVESIPANEAATYFGPIANLVTLDLAASSEATRAELGWSPTGPDLLTDLRALTFATA